MPMGTAGEQLHIGSPLQTTTARKLQDHALQYVMDGNRLRRMLRQDYDQRRTNQQPQIWSIHNSMPDIR
jgi:hypothetical protein